MPKAVRKDFFPISADELERILPRLLDNLRFSNVRIQGATGEAKAVAVDRANLGQHVVDLNLQLNIKWSAQGDGLTVIITIEEPNNEWTSCVCNRLADSMIGTLRTICELWKGVDV